MLTLISYNKFATLKSGAAVLIRFFKKGDENEMSRFFQNFLPEDVRYLKYFSANPQQFELFLQHTDYNKNISLVAWELDKESIIGAAFLSRGHGAINYIGKVYGIFVARPFQKMGLGNMLLDECIWFIRLGQELLAGPVKVSRFPCGS